jgi:hypothetical protein
MHDPFCWVPCCRRDELGQPLSVAAAANEAYKAARAKGQGDADFAAVYEAIATQPAAAQ